MKKVLAVLGGVATAFITMIIFEGINSFLFPFPQGLDVNDWEAVHTFTQNLPWTAYILVLLGWSVGAFLAGFVAKKIIKTNGTTTPVILSILLTLGGILNFILIGHPMWMIIIGLIIFVSLPSLGYQSSKITV